ncbi:MAG: hypothetical protein CVU84_00525 [Firmicutes bacterium HGW-Firmicutes-1]|jgi:ABC-2 type transport system permease protein|nr:MAG: hypothetical protein CVU84_00525 [Firmicutes bacterium HGW-Firmicutes-1]
MMSSASLFARMIYKNYIGQIRQFKRNIMLFVVPICIFLFVYLFFTLNNVEESFIEPLEVGLILEDESIYAGMVADGFTSSEAFTQFANVTEGTAEEVYEAFEEGKLDAVILMPKGFVKSVMNFSYNPILVKVNHKEPLKTLLIKNVIMSYEKYISTVEIGIVTLFDQMEDLGYDWDTLVVYNEQISYDLIFTALSRTSMFSYEEIVNVPSVVSTIYYFMAIIVMFLMYIAVYAAINLIREREDMCFVRLKISKISLFHYMISKALGTTLFISTIVLGWLLLFTAFTGGVMSKAFFVMCVFLIVAILFDVSIAMFMTAFIEREEGVILLSNIFIFINAIIGGSIIPIQMMPEALQKIAIISPNYWMIRGLLYFQSGYNLREGFYIGILLFVLSLFMLFITSKRYFKVCS